MVNIFTFLKKTLGSSARQSPLPDLPGTIAPQKLAKLLNTVLTILSRRRSPVKQFLALTQRNLPDLPDCSDPPVFRAGSANRPIHSFASIVLAGIPSGR
jgi:hypothetical protein